MRTRIKRAVISACLGLVALWPGTLRAQVAVPGECVSGVLPGGALSLMCVPAAGWNGRLVVLAHGYVAFNEPLDFYQLKLGDGDSIPSVVQSLGFAFATTSYRQNGLAILEGADDIRQLVAAFTASHSAPLATYLAGVSEGGLVAALLAERSPALFSSVLAMCGPIGSLEEQIEYFGDFRVLFDYFFPGVIPGSAIHIPPAVITNWDAVYVPRIVSALAGNPARAVELLRVARAAYDPSDAETVIRTTLDVLWYSVFATNDAFHKLGGNPYGNRRTLYLGSSDDLRLNLHVSRFVQSPVARAALRAYETSGELTIPLVTLHTTADDVVPFAQELRYLAKVDLSARGRFIPFPVFRYGHCNFTTSELVGAVLQAVAQP